MSPSRAGASATGGASDWVLGSFAGKRGIRCCRLRRFFRDQPLAITLQYELQQQADQQHAHIGGARRPDAGSRW